MENKGCTASMKSCSTEKKEAVDGKSCASGDSCFLKIFFGALLGGIVMFIYFAASWVVYPWHKTALLSFTDNRAHAYPLSDNSNIADLLVNRGVTHDVSPFIFDSVFRGGLNFDNLTPAVYIQFLFCMAAAAILTCLLKKSSAHRPTYFAMAAGMLVGIVHYIPDMIWYHFPLDYTVVGIGDDFLSITLAGIVISKCVLRCENKKTNCH